MVGTAFFTSNIIIVASKVSSGILFRSWLGGGGRCYVMWGCPTV